MATATEVPGSVPTTDHPAGIPLESEGPCVTATIFAADVPEVATRLSPIDGPTSDGSPSVVAAILMIQKTSVTSGTLLAASSAFLLLGFGFGAVKGTVVVVLGFSVLALGYDVTWGRDGRPQWITQARSYPFVNAASEKLVDALARRRAEANGEASPPTDAGDDVDPPKPARKRHRPAGE